MRSTWTWDDRALRRDLSSLLVELAAAQRRRRRRGDRASPACPRPRHRRALRRRRAGAAPDRGRRQRIAQRFLSAASDPAAFDRAASRAQRRSASRCSGLPSRALRDRLSRRIDVVQMRRQTDAGTGRGDARLRLLTQRPHRCLRTLGLAWQTLRALGTDGAEYARTDRKRRDPRDSRGCRAIRFLGSRARSHEGPARWRRLAAHRAQSYSFPMRRAPTSILTVARSIAGPSLFAVDADAAGLTVTELAPSTRPDHCSRVEFERHAQPNCWVRRDAAER